MVFKGARIIQENVRVIEDFIVGENPGEPSDLVKACHFLAEDVGQRVGLTVNAGIRGSMGGMMQGLNRDLEQVAIDQDPNLALVQSLPKSLKKNKMAMEGLMYLIQQNKFAGSASHNSNGGSGRSQVKFNL